MAYKNYIVVIDLGTSHLVGMVGVKNAQGRLSILAEEVEPSAACIRRGCVYNEVETANRINRLISKLQNKLDGKLPSDFSIEKAYIGVRGQSLRTYKHVEVKIINTNSVVSEEDIQNLDKQCRTFKPDLLDVLGISSPVYYADGTVTDSPVGISCKRIEAHYRLIVGKPAIRNNIINSINRTKIKLAGIIVSPLALADAVFSRNEKELGCALLEFGAGVTSVAIYRQNELIHLAVIPLGGNLITRDLKSLRLLDADAEQLKIKYGSAVLEKNKDSVDSFEAKEGIGLHEINIIVEARAREIVENVYAQVKSTGEMDALGKIVLAGGASALKNLRESVHERFKKEVNFSTIRKEWMEANDERIGNTRYMTAISLLIKGTENCIHIPTPIVDTEKDGGEKKEDKKKKKKKEGESAGGNLFDRIIREIFEQD